MPTNKKSIIDLDKMKRTNNEEIEHRITHEQIGDTTVSDIPKKGEQTSHGQEDKAGKGY